MATLIFGISNQSLGTGIYLPTSWLHTINDVVQSVIIFGERKIMPCIWDARDIILYILERVLSADAGKSTVVIAWATRLSWETRHSSYIEIDILTVQSLRQKSSHRDPILLQPPFLYWGQD